MFKYSDCILFIFKRARTYEKLNNKSGIIIYKYVGNIIFENNHVRIMHPLYHSIQQNSICDRALAEKTNSVSILCSQYDENGSTLPIGNRRPTNVTNKAYILVNLYHDSRVHAS